MIFHDNEIMEPDDLALLGTVFDEAWAELGSLEAGDISADERTRLAGILLRLAHLKQLGPDQMKATALRIFRAHAVRACIE